TSSPRIQIEKGAIVLRTSGIINIEYAVNETKSNLESSVDLLQGKFRLAARLRPSVTVEKRLTATTSSNDLALMMSGFEILDQQIAPQIFNKMTSGMAQSLAPLLIDLINADFRIGLRFPLLYEDAILSRGKVEIREAETLKIVIDLTDATQ